MNDDIANIKLNAFLHDPVYKPLILMQRGYDHKAKAAELASYLGISVDEDRAKVADIIASGADRLLMPSGSNMQKDGQVRFNDNPLVLHPLGGANKHIDGAIVQGMIEAVEEAFKEIGQKMKGRSSEELYLYIWRKLLPIVEAHTPPETSKYWRFMPADTRVPDHSIWDHMDMTSACSVIGPSDEDKLVFAIMDIGPVQNFIEQARKTQDMWMGSFILSYLNWTAMKPAVEAYGPDSVIFPKLREQPFVDKWLKEEKHLPDIEPSNLSTPTLTNRFLALLPIKDAKMLMEKGKEAVKAELKNMGQFAIEQLGIQNERGIVEQLERQMADMFNIYYIVIPWSESGYDSIINRYKEFNDGRLPAYFRELTEDAKVKNSINSNYLNAGVAYELAYTMAEKSLAARKNLRDFKQDAEPGLKCSVCGEREVLRPDQCATQGQVKTFWDKLAARITHPGLLGPGERLCGPCLAKRLCGDYFKVNAHFPSVSDIATAYFKEDIAPRFDDFYKEISSVLGRHAGVAGGSNVRSFEGEFLYEETLTPQRLKKDYGITVSQAEADMLQNALKKLYAMAKHAPSKYYAVLCMDGDDMGKWLSGAKAPLIKQVVHPDIAGFLESTYGKTFMNTQRPMSPALHSAISTALKDYSVSMAKTILESGAKSKLIYAGGDDVLALVNLRDLPSVMLALRAYFSGHVDDSGNPDFAAEAGWVSRENRMFTVMGPLATASMGISIAHYKEPLQLVIASARSMEERAKSLRGKNAFAIEIIKHSGERRCAAAKWYYDSDDQPFNTIERCMIAMIDFFRRGDVSSNFLYTLKQELNGFGNTALNMFEVELKRLMKRSLINESTEGLDALSADMMQFLQYTMDYMPSADAYKNLMDFVEIAYFIAKER